MALKVKLIRIEDQVVYRVGGVQGLSTLVGHGFVYDDKGYEHGENLEVYVLKPDGINLETDRTVIDVEPPKIDEKNDTNFPVKIRVFSDIPYSAAYNGYRNVVIKKVGENLTAVGACPANSKTCSILPNAIRIKPADD